MPSFPVLGNIPRGADPSSDLEEQIDAFRQVLEPDPIHRLGDHSPSLKKLSVFSFQDCDGCLRMRIQIHIHGDIRVLHPDHKLYDQGLMSAYDPSLAISFNSVVIHEWDHANTFHVGMFNELQELEPLMERRFDSIEEYNRSARCVSNKVKALYKEAGQHSSDFDTLEFYSKHYAGHPFQPRTNLSECLPGK